MTCPVRRLRLLSNYLKISVSDARGWDTGSAGQANYWDNTVRLHSQASEDVQRLTACHEITHHIASLTGINLDEAQTQAVGLGILSMIRENKKFIKWLQQEDEGDECDSS